MSSTSASSPVELEHLPPHALDVREVQRAGDLDRPVVQPLDPRVVEVMDERQHRGQHAHEHALQHAERRARATSVTSPSQTPLWWMRPIWRSGSTCDEAEGGDEHERAERGLRQVGEQVRQEEQRERGDGGGDEAGTLGLGAGR